MSRAFIEWKRGPKKFTVPPVIVGVFMVAYRTPPMNVMLPTGKRRLKNHVLGKSGSSSSKKGRITSNGIRACD
jgi:hypothetical protein